MSGPVSVFQAAKSLCSLSGWNLSNLQLQKILYLAQVVYMGENNGDRLFDADFEAWDFGPVAPSLYHRVKSFGDEPVGNVFHGARPITDESRDSTLDRVGISLFKKTPGQLVAMTHRPDGAWAKFYRPNMPGIHIPDEEIFQEYARQVA